MSTLGLRQLPGDHDEDAATSRAQQSRENRRRMALVIGVVVLFFLTSTLPVGRFSCVLGLGGCDEDLTTSVESSPPFITFFLLDGVSSGLLGEELAKGNLPNIAKLASDGVFFPRGVTSFPSMTGYAFIPFITGQDAAESGVLGLRWFDRTREVGCFRTYVGAPNVNMELDLSPRLRTIYEQFPTNHSYASMTYMARGAKARDKLAWGVTTAKYSKMLLFLILRLVPGLCPNWIEFEGTVLDRAIADLKKFPKIQWIVFPSPDGVHHMEGSSPDYRRVLAGIDKLVGKYRRQSAALGQEHNRIYAVIADHGMSEVHKNIDLTSGLGAHLGFRTYRGTPSTKLLSSSLTRTISSFDGFQLIDAINGDNMDYVYVKHPKFGWRRGLEYSELVNFTTPSGDLVNLPELFAHIEGVELVAFRGPAPLSVRIVTSTGESQISSNDALGSVVDYSLVRGKDPLSILGSSVSSVSRTPGQWLKETFNSEFPYAPVRLWRLVNSKAATVGDLIVTSVPGYDFGLDYEMFVGNYKGGHGGLRRDQMQVPFILSGPGFRHNVTIATATNEDIGATIARVLLGPGANSHQSPETVISRGQIITDALLT